MASTDARPVPIKNTAYRHYFAIRKNDGTLITTWAGQDSEVSLDGAAFADCTNEATEIGTTGCGYIDLTASEMNADAVMLKVTVTNTSALTYVVTFFPEEAGDINVDVTAFGGVAGTFSNGRAEVNTTHAAGTAWNSGGITRSTFAAETGLQSIRSNTAQSGSTASITLDASASSTADYYVGSTVYITGGAGVGQYGLITAYNGTSKLATVHANWKTQPDNTSTFSILPYGVADTHLLDGQTLTASAGISVGVYIGGTGPAALETTSQTILADTNELQTDWANGGRLDVILDARASQASVDTVDDFLDTEIAAIKAVTDKLDTGLEQDGPVYRATTNFLEQAPAGGGGGSGDWTADEKTAIRTILGIPGSGTTPATPSDGVLADILALLSAEAISHSPVISDSLIVVVEDDTYDGVLNSKIFWTTTTNYTGATITFHVWRQNSDGSRTDMLAAPISGTVVSSVRVELATFTATFNTALSYSGVPAFEKLQFACVATASSKEYTVAIGDLVVKERR